MTAGPIWLLTGTPGAGKSTVARLLAQRYQKAVHIPVDDLRHLVVRGFASPVEGWTDETTRQFGVARRTAARLAAEHSDAGFAVVLDDVIPNVHALGPFLRELGVRSLAKVHLAPRVDVAVARNAARVVGRLHDDRVRELHALLLEGVTPQHGWLVVDSSDLDPQATVDVILAAQAGRAGVG